MRNLAALILLFAAPAACGFPKDEGQKLRDQTYALMTQVTSMQEALTALQNENKKQNEQLAKISSDVELLNKSSRRNDADLGAQLDEALGQVGRVKGLVESFQDRLSSVEAAVNKASEEADARFKQLQEQQRVDQLKSQEEKQRAIDLARKKERLVGEPSALFEEVQRMITNGDPGTARELLREFGNRAKSDKNLDKRSGEAAFLLGETYFAEGKYQAAAAEYNNVRKNYPKSPKLAEALYRLGMCFEKLGLKDDAKLFYQNVIQKHAKSSVAKDAKARLDALK